MWMGLRDVRGKAGKGTGRCEESGESQGWGGRWD